MTGGAMPRGTARAGRSVLPGVGVLILLGLGGCEGRISEPDPSLVPPDSELRSAMRGWGVVPLGEVPTQNPARVALGQALFFDRELSGNRDVSCASCHRPSAGLGDGRSLPVGTGAVGNGPDREPGPDRDFVPRTSPSLFSVGLGLPYLFWDGRLTGFSGLRGPRVPALPHGLDRPLDAVAMLPVLDRTEMLGEPGDHDVFGNPNELAEIPDDRPVAIWEALMTRLLAIPGYQSLFAEAFPETAAGNLRFEHASRAIAAFMKESFTLTRSSFDRYLEGDDAALGIEEKRGASLFFDAARIRCVSCHGGPHLGGQSFANVGAPQVGPGGHREPPLDLGRGELQEQAFYRFAFRVPPLRNVELTAPYMHSGAYRTLEDVVRHYDDVPEALRSFDPTNLDAAVRHLHRGEEATLQDLLTHLDFRVREPLALSEDEMGSLVAFLRSLTDPRARDLAHLAPDRVPSGLPVDR